MDEQGHGMERAQRQRIAAALAVLALHLLFGLLLLAHGPGPAQPRAEQPVVLSFERVPPPLPPPLPRPVRQVAGRAQAVGGPPAHADAAPAAAPLPIVPLAPPAPLTAAVAPANGAGAAGQGANGAGAGSGGDDEGDGGAQPAVQIRGSLHNRDLPRDARNLDKVRVGVRFVVEPSGRVGACEVLRPSSVVDLDDIVCPLIQRRFRFDPARDGDGAPVQATLEEDEIWTRTSRQEDGPSAVPPPPTF